MPLSNAFVQNSISDPYRYAQIRGVTTNFSSVTVSGATTFFPPHKGFAITTGLCASVATNSVPIDLLFRDSAGITFVNRIGIAIGSTQFFPMQINGISANPTQFSDPAFAGSLNQTLVYFYS